MDFYQIGDSTLLVVTDYYSNFLSVEKLKVEQINCNEVIQILLNMFAIHGIPQEIITYKGLQFRSGFKEFMKQLYIIHITSRLYHPQENG